MTIMMTIKQRDFSGSNNNNVFTSIYRKSYKYAAAAFIAATPTHLAGVAIKTFKTKSEALLWMPTHPNVTFQDEQRAKEFYHAYCGEGKVFAVNPI